MERYTPSMQGIIRILGLLRFLRCLIFFLQPQLGWRWTRFFLKNALFFHSSCCGLRSMCDVLK
jgi:hypothetical protein